MSEWIEWSGGECPVDDDFKVQVELRNGQISKKEWAISAKDWYWDWSEEKCPGDIVAYRVISS